MYRLRLNGSVERLSDGAIIPLPANESEGFAYELWLNQGNKPEPAPAVDLSKIIAERRYRAETGGITFNNLQISTEDRSKLLISGAALEAVIDPDYVMQWKAGDGFISLNASQVIAIARAVRSHVQACFDRESELLENLSAGTLTEEMIGQGWP